MSEPKVFARSVGVARNVGEPEEIAVGRGPAAPLAQWEANVAAAAGLAETAAKLLAIVNMRHGASAAGSVAHVEARADLERACDLLMYASSAAYQALEGFDDKREVGAEA